jgi:hypothetical protein
MPTNPIDPNQLRNDLNRLAAAMRRADERRWQAKETKRTGLSVQELADRQRGSASPLGGREQSWWGGK